VQVESLAQVGVQLLLFTLGLEFRWVLCVLASICALDLRAGQTMLPRQPTECDALPPTGLATSQQHAGLTGLTEVHGLPDCSLSKLRAVRGVALLGGVLQVLLTMVLAGGVASAIGASIHEGVFIGALVRSSKP
jgi:predicted Kef-type K+ transport protein